MNIRNFKNKIINFISNKFVIALTISLFIISVSPSFFPKYIANLQDSGIIKKPNGIIKYNDLSGNGNSEKILLFENKEGYSAIQVFTSNNAIIDQWNFNGIHRNEGDWISVGDYNKNRIAEIYLVLINNDSLFINFFEPLGSNKKVESFYCTNLNSISKSDYSVSDFFMKDIDGDGFDDVIFSINGGFALQPRKICMLNIRKKTVYTSPLSGVQLGSIQCAPDSIYTEKKLLVSTYAPNNYNDTLDIPFNDNSSWLFLFNSKLNYAFKPIEFKGKYSSLTTYFRKIEDRTYIISFFSCPTLPETLSIYNLSGKQIRKVELKKDNLSETFDFCFDGLNYLLIGSFGNVYKVDEKLGLKYIFKLNNDYNKHPYFIKMNKNNKNSIFFLSKDNQKVKLFTSDFNYPVVLNIPHKTNKENFRYQVIKRNNSDDQIFIQKGDSYFVFSYRKNLLFLLSYLYPFLVFIIILGIVHFIQMSQKRMLEKKFNTEKKLRELQLLSIRNQIEPHFLFNSLDSMGSLFYKGDKELADRYFTKLSKMIRHTLMSSETYEITIQEELNFVQNYIQLNLLKAMKPFKFGLYVNDKVNLSQLIPKMIIFTFVENAIKHGINLGDGKGIVEITILQKVKSLFINIKDNGPGINSNISNSTSGTGKGLMIIEKMLLLYNEAHCSKISYTITDISGEDNEDTGTLVNLIIKY